MGVFLSAQMDTDNKIALAALIVSIISLVVAIISMIFQKRMNSINLEAEYYKAVFDKYLLEEIPHKVSALKFDTNKKLNKNYKELNDTMMEMIRKARYFSFSNPSFYKKLSEMSMELDEKLVNLSGKKVERAVDQKEMLQEIEDCVSKIIVYINKNYSKKI